MSPETKDKLSELKDYLGWCEIEGNGAQKLADVIMKLIELLIEDKNDPS